MVTMIAAKKNESPMERGAIVGIPSALQMPCVYSTTIAAPINQGTILSCLFLCLGMFVSVLINSWCLVGVLVGDVNCGFVVTNSNGA